MKKVFVFLTLCLFYNFTFVSVSEHLLNNNRVHHIIGAKSRRWDSTSKYIRAKDVDGPLTTRTRTYVVQYADDIKTGPNKYRDKQHHWHARSEVKNTNPDYKGHYFMEVEFPYPPANTVMVDPPIGPGTEDVGITRPYEGIITKRLPRPLYARGVVTTAVPYDVNESTHHCLAWATISGGPYEPGKPFQIIHASFSSIPWEEHGG